MTLQNSLTADRKMGRRPRGRWLIYLVAGLVLLLAVGAVWQAAATAATAQKYPAPGRLVDVGGYRLHLYCMGEGSPTMVLDAGLYGSVLDWSRVQPELAKTTRVCAYDRAGMGWSDPGPAPRTSEQMVKELRTLLANAGLKPPYVLAGHSFGALNMQLYARRYSDEVVALVLVDGTHPALSGSLSPEVRSKVESPLWAADLGRGLGRMGIVRLSGNPNSPQLRKLPDQVRSVSDALGWQTKVFDAAYSELATVGESEAQVLAAPELRKELPVVIIGAPMKIAEAEKAKRSLYEAMVQRSAHGKLYWAEQSGHYVHLDQPEMVIAAFGDAVAAARK